MDIFTLKAMTQRQMTNEEKLKLQSFVGSLIENVRDTLKERKGLETKITSITETSSPMCPTEAGVKMEFVIERKGVSRVVSLTLVPSHQKIYFASHDSKNIQEVTKAEFKMTMEGARTSALKIFDLIDFEDCFKKAS